MAIYDTEEEQLEQLKKWWESNRNSILSGLAGGIIVIAAVNFWHNYKMSDRMEASQLYQELLDTAALGSVKGESEKNSESLEKIAEKLVSEHRSSAYADYSVLLLVKSKVEKGDLDTAKSLLQQEIKNSDNAELRHICRLRLIQLLLATKDYEQGLKLISEVDPATQEGFAASYDELQGDLYLALDRTDEARSAYQSAIRTGQATPLVQFKLDDIAAPALNPITGK